MPLSISTKNWMIAPYQMDMDALKDVAKKEASAIIDGLRNDAEIRFFLAILVAAEFDIFGKEAAK